MNGEVLKNQLIREQKELKKWDEIREKEDKDKLVKREELLSRVEGVMYGYK